MNSKKLSSLREAVRKSLNNADYAIDHMHFNQSAFNLREAETHLDHAVLDLKYVLDELGHERFNRDKNNTITKVKPFSRKAPPFRPRKKPCQ